jgi:Pyruvate/2-oxoacid:ferredoxin oxidoreductase delta subunit
VVLREVVKIDKEKCIGCGLCIPACAEGALRIVDGKAELIDDKFCDGLGACLGECPEDAIIIEKRDAEEFDEIATEQHLSATQPTATPQPANQNCPTCPSAQVVSFEEKPVRDQGIRSEKQSVPQLSQWPVQLALLPPNAPFFENADLLIAADCVPFAYPDFHNDFLKGKTVVVGCPKLDNATLYRTKLTEILKQSNVKSLTVVNMEVPCCFGLHRLVQEAIGLSGKTIPLKQQIISIKGKSIPPHSPKPKP